MRESRNNHHVATTPLDCDDFFDLLPALVEGSLSYARTTGVLEHLRGCPRCEQTHAEFRAFMLTEAELPVEEPVRHPATVPQPQTSPFWAEWQDRLNRWLDVMFPNTVTKPAFRSAGTSGAAEWESAARKQSHSPLLTAREGNLHLTMHVARGLIFGWITTLTGEPLYPMLLSLVSEQSQEAVLNQPDGTFQLRWDPEATALDCQTPSGVTTRFTLSTDG